MAWENSGGYNQEVVCYEMPRVRRKDYKNGFVLLWLLFYTLLTSGQADEYDMVWYFLLQGCYPILLC